MFFVLRIVGLRGPLSVIKTLFVPCLLIRSYVLVHFFTCFSQCFAICFSRLMSSVLHRADQLAAYILPSVSAPSRLSCYRGGEECSRGGGQQSSRTGLLSLIFLSPPADPIVCVVNFKQIRNLLALEATILILDKNRFC
jgi:hypothetical protein